MKRSQLIQIIIFFSSVLMRCRSGIGLKSGERLKGWSTLLLDSLSWINKGTRRSGTPPTISGSAESRVLAIRNRLNIIKQCVLRNEHFAPSTLPSHDRERLVTVRFCDLRFTFLVSHAFSRIAEIHKATTWSRGGAVFAFGNACTLERGRINARGLGWTRRIRLLEAGQSNPFRIPISHRNLKLNRINQEMGCLQRAALRWWKVNTPRKAHWKS